MSSSNPPLVLPAPRGRIAVHGAPEGHDAYLIGDLVVRGAVPDLLHVCHDDSRMARFASALAFFHPDLDIVTVPAWDCLPYDRVSPNAEIVSRRIDALIRLADLKEFDLVITDSGIGAAEAEAIRQNGVRLKVVEA